MQAREVPACRPMLQERRNLPRKPESEIPRPSFHSHKLYMALRLVMSHVVITLYFDVVPHLDGQEHKGLSVHQAVQCCIKKNTLFHGLNSKTCLREEQLLRKILWQLPSRAEALFTHNKVKTMDAPVAAAAGREVNKTRFRSNRRAADIREMENPIFW